jgi:hypothetical protein
MIRPRSLFSARRHRGVLEKRTHHRRPSCRMQPDRKAQQAGADPLKMTRYSIWSSPDGRFPNRKSSGWITTLAEDEERHSGFVRQDGIHAFRTCCDGEEIGDGAELRFESGETRGGNVPCGEPCGVPVLLKWRGVEIHEREGRRNGGLCGSMDDGSRRGRRRDWVGDPESARKAQRDESYDESRDARCAGGTRDG